MINQVAFAAAVDDARPTLTGVSTSFEGSKVMMAATDGFRLSGKIEGNVGDLAEERAQHLAQHRAADLELELELDLAAVLREPGEAPVPL